MLTSAKYCTFIKPLLLGSLVIVTTQTITTNALAESKYDDDRWFEVEVILFRQLGDKRKLKEQFTQDTQSVTSKLYDENFNLKRRTKRVIELLKPFLKPDTNVLKLQFPVCGEQRIEQSYFEQAAIPPPFFQSLSLDGIKKLPFNKSTTSNYFDIAKNTINDNVNENVNQGINENKKRYSDGIYTGVTPTSNPLSNEDYNKKTTKTVNKPLKKTIVGSEFSSTFEPFFEPPSPEIIALVAKAKQVFSPFQFNLSQDHLPTKKHISQAQICQLSSKVLSQLKTQEPNFDKNNFTVDKVPTTIDAAENLYSNRPYLLSQSSLKLNDIVKQLRWSKTFKPLLHIGWRLAPKDRIKAIPLHIFAGNNLIADYQKQLIQYNKAINAVKQSQQTQVKNQQQSNTVNNQRVNINNAQPKQSIQLPAVPLTKSEQYKQAINVRLTSILPQLINFDKDSDEIINELDNKNLTLKLNSENEQIEQSLAINKPQPPLQPWYLEGLFKVHLNRYLFITADFTIINKTLAEQASESIKPTLITEKRKIEDKKTLKLIEFKQNRRVISKEIHYFDNPYLGMIVQIRRHKRPELPVNKVEVEK